MYKGLRRWIVVVITNEQMIEKMSFLFRKTNSSICWWEWTNNKKNEFSVLKIWAFCLEKKSTSSC
jgi:hypothetical protein